MRKAMNRDDYLIRAHEFAQRGQDLPQSKLTDEQVVKIRAAQQKREDLRTHIREKLSNEALAREMGVHVRTVEKVLHGGAWAHLLARQPMFDVGAVLEVSHGR